MIELTARARELLSQTSIEIQLIVEIDDLDFVFGASPVISTWNIGDAIIRVGDIDLLVGGVITNPESKPVIDLSSSTKTISQQLEIEQGVSSVSSIKARIIDEEGFATMAFSPSGGSDILGRGATVYIAIKGGAHPEDSIRIFDGMIDDCTFGAGFADLNISHPEQFKRQAIFPKWESELLTNISKLKTPDPLFNVEVLNMDALIDVTPSGVGTTYFQIDDEILEFSALDYENKLLKGLLKRSLFKSYFDKDYEIEDTISSFYYLNQNPIDLALYILCSTKIDASPFYLENAAVAKIEVNPFESLPTVIECTSLQVAKANIQIGDTLTLSAASLGAHPVENLISVTVQGVSKSGLITKIKTDSLLVEDSLNQYLISIKSKWNKLPDGCGIQNRYIDFEGFSSIKAIHGSELTNSQIFLKDTIEDAKEFIDQVIFRPQGLYSIPRKGRISLGKAAPPVANKETKTLYERNVLNPSKLKIGRSINKNFYNSIIYKYDQGSIDDKFYGGEISIDATSLKRIKVGARSLTIEAPSLRRTPEALKVIRSQSKRLLERYRFASETMPEVEVDFETGINIDVGDTVVCQFSKLEVSDITNGTRKFTPRLMEVINKTLNITKGKITLDLSATVFEVDGRYATIAPSSTLTSGASKTVLPLKKSYSRFGELNEKGKWEQYNEQRVIVRSPDWSIVYETKIINQHAVLDAILVEELPEIPLVGMIVESPKYDDSSYLAMSLWKTLHAYMNPCLKITANSVINNQVTVSEIEALQVKKGASIKIHSPDYSRNSVDLVVKDINYELGLITTSATLPFLPLENDLIELVGYLDDGQPYRIV